MCLKTIDILNVVKEKINIKRRIDGSSRYHATTLNISNEKLGHHGGKHLFCAGENLDLKLVFLEMVVTNDRQTHKYKSNATRVCFSMEYKELSKWLRNIRKPHIKSPQLRADDLDNNENGRTCHVYSFSKMPFARPTPREEVTPEPVPAPPAPRRFRPRATLLLRARNDSSLERTWNCRSIL
ncbi:hypothetical protein EVAR_85683_1 [Eumeta japonica]|uniref:Uncharacterized protein n=1 Tax=Eumeta variegata TaxID=151549 RepID=A0A4C1W9K1_EUMVA|nr:hypothetical protein EVAR_85683_1 [Eumeta japonica]